jgi:hypothetical protein
MHSEDELTAHEEVGPPAAGGALRRRRRTVVVRALVLALTIGAIAYLVVDARREPDLPDLRNGQAFIQDNLWSTDDHQYAVWVARDGTPFAGMRERGADDWEVSDLSQIPGNPLATPTDDNLHNIYVIATDSLGYVHVVGNVRRSPLRYIRSANPADISAWVAGEIPGPADWVTYPQFVGLPDGTLLLFRREGMSGNAAVMLEALDPGSVEWRHVANVIDGRPNDESPYLHRIAVDPVTGVVHLLYGWRATGDVTTMNDVEYARSSDAGRTWETTDGRLLSLPIAHGDAELVIDTPPTDSGLLNQGGLAVDACGRPHAIVTFDNGIVRTLRHVWHDGAAWHEQRLDGGLLQGRPTIVADAPDQIWMAGARGNRIVAYEISSGAARQRVELGSTTARWEVVYDSHAAELHGRFEVLVPRDAQPEVVGDDLGLRPASETATAASC